MAFKVPTQHMRTPLSPGPSQTQQQQQQQPQQQKQKQKQQQKLSRPTSTLINPTTTPSPSRSTPATLEEQEEWIVFSPSSIDANTNKTPASGPFSRISDFGSFGTGDYDEDDEEDEEGALESLEEKEDDDDDDDEDDDIDLGGFRNPFHDGPVMLPTHDGLGQFPLESQQLPTLLPPPQQEDTMRFSPPTATNSFTHNRIQAWRIEQSRILLDEIERVTRNRLSLKMTEQQRREEEEVTMSLVGDGETQERSGMSSTSTAATEDQETFWRRLTRKVMHDIMGLDDDVLQIIFGEGLPPGLEEEESGSDSGAGGIGGGDDLRRMNSQWQERFLERLAKELGVSVNHYTQHSTLSAFSSYPRGMEIQPVGGDTTPHQQRQKSTPPLGVPLARQSMPNLRDSRTTASGSQFSYDDPMNRASFQPTLAPLQSSEHEETASHAAFWGIEDQPGLTNAASAASDARLEADLVRDYWEKELNLRMFFSFLKSRFDTSPSSPATSTTSYPPTSSSYPQNAQRRPSHANTSSSTDTATTPKTKYSTSTSKTTNKYANYVPVHHHPLIHHRHQQQQQQSQQQQHISARPRRINSSGGVSSTKRHGGLRDSVSSAISFGFPSFGNIRSGSSCASETTKRSGPSAAAARRNTSRGSSSTRHYWEVATSVSGGSVGVGVGVWGDV